MVRPKFMADAPTGVSVFNKTKQQEKTLKRQEELEKQKIVNMTEQQLAQLYNETVLKIKQKTSNLQNNLQELNRKKDLQQRWKMMDYLINSIDEISQSIVNRKNVSRN